MFGVSAVCASFSLVSWSLPPDAVGARPLARRSRRRREVLARVLAGDRLPAWTPQSFMIYPDEAPRVDDIPEEVIAGKGGRDRIVAAIASTLESTTDVTPLPDGSYGLHVRAHRGEAATCHGRYDELDLRGAAKLVGDSVEIDLTGSDRVTEDMCAASGQGREVVVRRRATASLHIAKKC